MVLLVEEKKMEYSKEEMEQKKVGHMRLLVESQDPTAKEQDDKMIRRFLRARNLDVEKGSAMFLKYLKWRREFVPNGYISESEVRNEIGQNKSYLQGPDKLGRPMSVIFGHKHVPTKGKDSLEEFKRYMVWGTDKLCASMPSGHEKFVTILDLQGWGYSNLDLRGYLGALAILQDFYPERLGKLYLVHVPYVFMTAWKLIYPFIDNNTKEKIVFVENKNLKSTLLQDIDECHLPDVYGGKQPLVPMQDRPVDYYHSM